MCVCFQLTIWIRTLNETGKVSGTLRSNLDPFGNYDDARLWDALKRAYLVEERKHQSIDAEDDDDGPGIRSSLSRFTLDSVVDAEGGNLSIGQVGSLI